MLGSAISCREAPIRESLGAGGQRPSYNITYVTKYNITDVRALSNYYTLFCMFVVVVHDIFNTFSYFSSLASCTI